MQCRLVIPFTYHHKAEPTRLNQSFLFVFFCFSLHLEDRSPALKIAVFMHICNLSDLPAHAHTRLMMLITLLPPFSINISALSLARPLFGARNCSVPNIFFLFSTVPAADDLPISVVVQTPP